MPRYSSIDVTDITRNRTAQIAEWDANTPLKFQVMQEALRQGQDPIAAWNQISPNVYDPEVRKQIAYQTAAEAGVEINDRQARHAAGEDPNTWEIVTSIGTNLAGSAAALAGGAGEAFFGDVDNSWQDIEAASSRAKKATMDFLEAEDDLTVADIRNAPSDYARYLGTGGDIAAEIGTIIGTGGISGGAKAFATLGKAAMRGSPKALRRLALLGGTTAAAEELPFAYGRETSLDSAEGVNMKNVAIQTALAGALGVGVTSAIAGVGRKYMGKKALMNKLTSSDESIESALQSKAAQRERNVATANAAEAELRNEAEAAAQQAANIEKRKVNQFHPGKEDIVDIPEYKAGRQEINKQISSTVREGTEAERKIAEAMYEASYKLDPDDVANYARWKALKAERDVVARSLYDEAARPIDEVGQVVEDYASKASTKLDAIDKELEKLFPSVQKVNTELGQTMTKAAKEAEQAARRLPVKSEAKAGELVRAPETAEAAEATVKGKAAAKQTQEAVEGIGEVATKAERAAGRTAIQKAAPQTDRLLADLEPAGQKQLFDVDKVLKESEDFSAAQRAKAAAEQEAIVQAEKTAAKAPRAKGQQGLFSKSTAKRTEATKAKLAKEAEETAKRNKEFKEAYENNKSFKNSYDKSTDAEYRKFAETNAGKYKDNPRAASEMRKDFKESKTSAFAKKNSKKLEAKDKKTVEKAIEEINETRKKSGAKPKQEVRCK